MQRDKIVEIIIRLTLGITLLLFLVSHLMWISNNVQYLSRFHGIDMSFIKIIKLVYYLTYLIIPTIIIIAFIGFFLKNYIGWIFLSNIFYFKLFSLFFIQVPGSNKETIYYLILFIPMLFILLMNTRNIRNYYKMMTKVPMTQNLIVILISLLFVYIDGYIKIHHSTNMLEIIDNITCVMRL